MIYLKPYPTFLLGILVLSLSASPAMAYVGPGAGLTAIGAFVAFVAAVIVAIVAFIWFPIRRMLRKSKQKDGVQADELDDDA